MIIAVAGIKRSGSTAQFNVIRIAYELAGYKVNVCGHGYQPRRVPKGEIDLVKRHPYSECIADAADLIFLTNRSDEEILESLSRFNGTPADPKRLPRMRRELRKWARAGLGGKLHVLHYQLLVDDPQLFVNTIVHHLPVDVEPDYVYKEFTELTPPKKGQDKRTLLFHNHITS